ncbi:nuclear transport factor 2 family protein [Streptomyces cellostaticus]|uniref:nuclear transport factor 2 family protein n=1 Tax=Streptomyces cellostaticus TaxID=67285 RepID=UPI00202650FB|nr:nuclear transport factor 2 family protein [Streptomyces cellostaticus]
MSIAETVSTDPTLAGPYQLVQQFYARQMRLLDDGRAEEWAETFTSDGVFNANAFPQPVVGRAAIAAAARAAVDDYARRGIQRRHWLGMLSVRPGDGEELLVGSYALVVETPRGGTPEIRSSSICDDVLVHEYGTWRVKDRQIRRDDIRPGA